MAGSSDSVMVSLTAEEYDEMRKKASKKAQDDERKLFIDKTANELIEKYHLKYILEHHRIYRYQDGVYRPDGREFIAHMVEIETGGRCNNHMVGEIIGKIERRTMTKLDESDKNPNILNVNNGLLDLTTGELMPHNPDHVSFTQLPVDYDPNADCPAIKQFFHDVVRSEDIPLLVEVVGWTLHWWEYKPHRAVMLYGTGRNGKGTFLRLLTALLGPDNVSCVGLQELVTNRFAPYDLLNKAANLAGDLPMRDMSESDKFKSATGGDRIRIENKNVKSIDYTNWAKMIFGANKLPKSADNTPGFYSRWIIVEFPFRFGPEGHPRDNEIDNKLQTPEELSGLLNLALEGLQRMRANGMEFSYRLTIEDVGHMYRRLSDPVFAFLQDCCEADPEGTVTNQELHEAYKKYALENGLPSITPKKLTQSVEDQDIIPVDRGTTKGGSIRVWRGIKLKNQ